jgi:hypothetical protein
VVPLSLPCWLREMPPLAASNQHMLGRKYFAAREHTKNKGKYEFQLRDAQLHMLAPGD